MKVTKTGQKHGITAYCAALSAGCDRNQALTIGAYAMLGLTKLTPSAQLHPDNLKAARVEMTRVCLMTGLMTLGVK